MSWIVRRLVAAGSVTMSRLTLFLLYPDTMARIGLAAAITFLVGGLLLAGVLGLAMVWLVQLLF